MFLYQRQILQKMLFASKKPTVSFATTCWEKDWEILLKNPTYLKNQLIGYNNFSFLEKILIINNVKDPEKVKFFAQKRKDEGLLTHFYFAADLEKETLDFFKLKREHFKSREEGVLDDWVYYNASGILTALYKCRGEFFLYHTGDACLAKKVSWIEKAIKLTWSDVIPSPYLMVATSDSRHYHEICEHVYKFSPMDVSKADLAKIHGIDEDITIENVINGTNFYLNLIDQL